MCMEYVVSKTIVTKILGSNINPVILVFHKETGPSVGYINNQEQRNNDTARSFLILFSIE